MRYGVGAGREPHLAAEPSPFWSSAPYVINILLLKAKVKHRVLYSPTRDHAFELKVTFCVRGVIGIQFGNTFNNPKYYAWHQKGRPYGNFSPEPPHFLHPETIEEIDRRVAKKYPGEPVDIPDEYRMPIDQLVVTLDHWIEVVGEDHVSLGSDFDGGPPLAKGMHDIGDYQQVAVAMQKHGYSEERVRKVMGLNLLRLIRKVTEKGR